MSYVNSTTAHFSSFFLGNQVVRAHGATMIINLSARYIQRFEPMQRPKHRQDVGRRTKFWADDTCYDVHPLALWILCAAFDHAGAGSALYYYRKNNTIACTGGYWTGTPLDGLQVARRCMATPAKDGATTATLIPWSTRWRNWMAGSRPRRN